MKRTKQAAALGGAVVVAAAGSFLIFSNAGASEGEKVTICHATNSSSNPYTVNSVDPASVDETGNQFLSGHGDHTGPIFNPEADPPQRMWGDIIPPIESPTDPANDFPGLNWTDEGQRIWNDGCMFVAPTPTPTPTETTSPSPTPTETTSPSPTPTATDTGTPTTPGTSEPVPVTTVSPASPETPLPVDADEVAPVEIADPGALPPEDESVAVEPASPGNASVPTSVPAGGGAARHDR